MAFFEGKLLQCRNCPLKSKSMANPQEADHRTGRSRQASFSMKAGKHSTTPYTDRMKPRMDSEAGKTNYSQRMSVVDTVNGNLTCNKRLRRFSLRGRTKAHGQWQLFCLVHSIEKLQIFGSLGHLQEWQSSAEEEQSAIKACAHIRDLKWKPDNEEVNCTEQQEKPKQVFYSLVGLSLSPIRTIAA